MRILNCIKKIIILALPVIFFFNVTLIFGADNTIEIPFKHGEKLNFKVKWNFIHAGDAVLEIRSPDKEFGEKGYHFVMSTKSTPFVDLIYKVRDNFESYTDDSMTHSSFYRKISSGRRNRETIVNIDWKHGKAQYVKNGKKKDPIDIMEGSFDPLSVFYAYRLLKLNPGENVHAPVTDGKTNVTSTATVLKRETIKVPSGKYDSYLLELDFKEVGGVFKKNKDANIMIWVTADKRKIPLRFKSKVSVGSFIAELVSIEGI